MTADSYDSLNIADTRCGGNTETSDAFTCGEAGIYPSYIVTHRATTNTIYLFNESDYSASGYWPCGVVNLMDGQALDTAYDSGDDVEIWEVGCNAIIYVHCIAATPAPTYSKNVVIVASATDGYGKPFAYTAGTDYLVSPLLKIGRVHERKAGSTTDAKLIKVRMSD